VASLRGPLFLLFRDPVAGQEPRMFREPSLTMLERTTFLEPGSYRRAWLPDQTMTGFLLFVSRALYPKQYREPPISR
jgi:hypothetical protein